MNTQETKTPEAKKANVFSPAVDIVESRDEIVVWADMPGVREGDLHVTLDKNLLTIAARVVPSQHPMYQLAHCEYEEGNFKRVFNLSYAIEQDKIKATHKDGVLRLVLPKSEPAKPRTITVNTA